VADVPRQGFRPRLAVPYVRRRGYAVYTGHDGHTATRGRANPVTLLSITLITLFLTLSP